MSVRVVYAFVHLCIFLFTSITLFTCQMGWVSHFKIKKKKIEYVELSINNHKSYSIFKICWYALMWRYLKFFKYLTFSIFYHTCNPYNYVLFCFALLCFFYRFSICEWGVKKKKHSMFVMCWKKNNIILIRHKKKKTKNVETHQTTNWI